MEELTSRTVRSCLINILDDFHSLVCNKNNYLFWEFITDGKKLVELLLGTTDERVHRLGMATFLRTVYSVMMVFTAQLGEGGECTPSPYHSIYPFHSSYVALSDPSPFPAKLAGECYLLSCTLSTVVARLENTGSLAGTIQCCRNRMTSRKIIILNVLLVIYKNKNSFSSYQDICKAYTVPKC